ncbi:MAG: CRTAC1 family protein, partial [Planctomycetales bacterium]|nr:CRTAC1 family protein [Planctomycetales bacterium]
AVAGVGYGGYSASSTWFDADSDGLLDLFVANYLQVDVSDYRICHEPATTGAKLAIPCPPWTYPGDPDRFYRNLGDGRFADETVDRGIAAVDAAHGLGVVVGDFDADGDVDLYVANDADLNHLWMNDGEGQFEELGLLAGTAVNADGAREAGMGVAAGDVTGDGLPELFVTNYFAETNTLYRNEGTYFVDGTASAKLAGPSINYTGFGLGFADFNNDTLLDLYVANGRVGRNNKAIVQSDIFAEPNQLFVGESAGRFTEAILAGGTDPTLIENSRSAAFGDYDNDGDVDVVIVNNGGTARLLRNRSGASSKSFRMRVLDRSGRDAIGAMVGMRQGPTWQWRCVGTSYSYLSSNEPFVHFGLGRDAVDGIVVKWPSGTEQAFDVGSIPLPQTTSGVTHLNEGSRR